MSTACPENAITGANGNVVCDNIRIARITNWTLTASVGETTFADSDSGGFTNRLPTRKEITGSADFKFDTNFPQHDRIREGECCHLVLFINATFYWDIPVALITSLSITTNVEDLEVVEGTFEFASSGQYYAPSEAGAHAHVLPAAPA